MTFIDPDYGPDGPAEIERKEALAAGGCPDGVQLSDWQAARPGLEEAWDRGVRAPAFDPSYEPEAGG